jgi:hypothetical protein
MAAAARTSMVLVWMCRVVVLIAQASCSAAMLRPSTSTVWAYSVAVLNSTHSVPASTTGMCPGGA